MATQEEPLDPLAKVIMAIFAIFWKAERRWKTHAAVVKAKKFLAQHRKTCGGELQENLTTELACRICGAGFAFTAETVTQAIRLRDLDDISRFIVSHLVTCWLKETDKKFEDFEIILRCSTCTEQRRVSVSMVEAGEQMEKVWKR